MSHIQLLQDDKPFDHQDHLYLIRQRLLHAQAIHKKRITNVNMERRIVMQDIWDTDAFPGERRVTIPTGHNIINLGASMLLPKPPSIRIFPAGNTDQALREADTVQRWTYAALDQTRAWNKFYSWAKETMFGAAALHMTPDPFAMHDEVPIILDVPDSASTLYQMGPRGKLDYVFLKHKYTARELRRIYNTTPIANPINENAEATVYTYYVEERYITEGLDGKPITNKMILYAALQGNSLIWPLTDITAIWPNIPVFMAFNQDGYEWDGYEEMRGMGLLTQHQQLLLFASDYMSQLANGMIKFINPPFGVTTDGMNDPPIVDTRPGAQNDLRPGEKIEPLTMLAPNGEMVNFNQQIKQLIAEGTFPAMLIQTPDLSGVSGSAFAEASNPTNVKNANRQQGFQYAMQDAIGTFLRHMAAVMDPVNGFLAFGVDPRDRQQLSQLAHPGLILKNCRVQIEMSEETPRNVFQYVTLLLQLADKHVLPERLVSETVTQLLSLKVSNFEDMQEQIASDKIAAARLQVMQQSALDAMPHLKEYMNNQQQNPQATSSGQRPFVGNSQQQDPMLIGRSMAPTQQLPQNGPPQLPPPPQGVR